MEQSGRLLMQRIRSVKSSLENAEQSFKENQGMRGELDLMLAEAEMKNLRRRQAVPWNWNRQTLALCAACMLMLAGFGGWYWAQGAVSGAYGDAAGRSAAAADALPRHDADKQQPQQRQAAFINQNNHSSSNAAGSGPSKEAEGARAQLSEQEMWMLVRSARAELSNAN